MSVAVLLIVSNIIFLICGFIFGKWSSPLDKPQMPRIQFPHFSTDEEAIVPEEQGENNV